jgi:hypothetical protein
MRLLLRGPRVRISLPPAESLPNFSSDVVFTRAGKEEASAKDKPMHRGLGSIDFTAACRSVLKVGFDPNDADKRVVTHAKSNLACPQAIAGLHPQGFHHVILGRPWSHHGQAPRFRSSPDSPLEGDGFEPSVPRMMGGDLGRQVSCPEGRCQAGRTIELGNSNAFIQKTPSLYPLTQTASRERFLL